MNYLFIISFEFSRALFVDDTSVDSCSAASELAQEKPTCNQNPEKYQTL